MKNNLVFTVFIAALLAGCSANNSPVGSVDVNRIVANWATYQNDQQQLLQDEQSISRSKLNARQKGDRVNALQKKYAGITLQLTQQIRDAASKVAQQRNLKLVVTKEGLGYGGVDITPDVEKLMNITEKATPSPT